MIFNLKCNEEGKLGEGGEWNICMWERREGIHVVDLPFFLCESGGKITY